MASKFWAGLLVLGGAVACATAPTLYPSHPLVDQIIKVRDGHEGFLTNRACLKYDGEACVEERITQYPLESAEFRRTANRLNFLCNIGGKRFKICLDKPGFCRFSYTRKCTLGIFCGAEQRLEEYLPVSDYRYLLDANARCSEKNKYDLWGIP